MSQGLDKACLVQRFLVQALNLCSGLLVSSLAAIGQHIFKGVFECLWKRLSSSKVPIQSLPTNVGILCNGMQRIKMRHEPRSLPTPWQPQTGSFKSYYVLALSGATHLPRSVNGRFQRAAPYGVPTQGHPINPIEQSYTLDLTPNSPMDCPIIKYELRCCTFLAHYQAHCRMAPQPGSCPGWRLAPGACLIFPAAILVRTRFPGG